MNQKSGQRPIDFDPKWDDETETASYFETLKTHQEASQRELISRNKEPEELAYCLADAAHSLALQFFEQVGNDFETSCKSGCSYCCHQPATVFAFEAIRIARELKNSLTSDDLKFLEETMVARVNDFKGSSVGKQINNKAACPLLTNHQCSVYASRPLTCRLAHSFSVKKCRQAFEKDRNLVQIPVALELLSAVSGIIEAVYGGLPGAKLDANLYELSSAVLVALSQPDAASKWASGDRSIFRNCIKDDT